MALYGGVTLPGKPDLENVRRLDLLCIPMIRQMQRVGIAVDVPYLNELSVELGREMVELEKDIASYIPHDSLTRFSDRAAEIEEESESATINANSAVQIRELLFDLLKLGRGKELKTTGAGAISTGKKQLELLRDDHPVIAKVLEYRERSKLKSAFTDKLPTHARFHPRSIGSALCPVCELPHSSNTWRIHTEFPTTRTDTGRLASRKPNLQQIPQRTVLGERIRLAFIPSPGRRLISADFSQIELRDLAHLANASSMIDVYSRNGDIHVYTACACFNRDEKRMTNLLKRDDLNEAEKAEVHHFKLFERLPSKNLNFMTVYGATAKGFQAQLAISGIFWSEEECERFMQDKWFGIYPEVRDYMDLQAYRVRRYGFNWDPWGRVRLVPEVRSTLSWIKSAGIRQAGNMPIQACSAGQTKLVMGELCEVFDTMREDGYGFVWPLLSIHDQVMAEADEEIADECAAVMAYVFSQVMTDRETGEHLWRVPITSDSEVLDRWRKS